MSDDMKRHTVRELIALLQDLDPDAEVITEGCDCYGVWDGSAEPGDPKGPDGYYGNHILLGRK